MRQPRYKSESAGREFVEGDPQFTSQLCSRCGLMGQRDSRQFTCPNYGLDCDVDLNAPANILQRAFGSADEYEDGSDLAVGVDGGDATVLACWFTINSWGAEIDLPGGVVRQIRTGSEDSSS